MPAPVFLTARWVDLLMVNYEIEPGLLEPFVPAQTALDDWQGRTLMSVVAFRFEDTRVRGVPIPLHRRFEELNLRFYVRREAEGEVRRGVVFIKEVVPLPTVAWVARRVYNENYEARPMNSSRFPGEAEQRLCLKYQWLADRRVSTLAAEVCGAPETPGDDTEETFISEHYWGYVRQRDGSTLEYQVEHPRWRLWRAEQLTIDVDWDALYDPTLAKALRTEPTSAFVAEGSEVAVRQGVRI